MPDNKQLAGLPLSGLIGAPLSAAAEASLQLAEASARYIDTVGFIQSGPDKGKPRQLDFSFERPKQDEKTGRVALEKVHVQVPLLAIAPAPNLQIDSVDVEFNLEIRSATTDKSTDAAQKSSKMDVSENKIQLHAVASTHKEHTRSSDTSSKYHFQLRATNHGVSEALARIMDLMASGVAALPPDDEKKEEPADEGPA